MTAGPRRGAFMVLLGACLIAMSWDPARAAQLPAPEPALHLVVPFENTRGDTRGYWLSEASSVLLADDLATLGAASIRREDRLRVFERLRVPPARPMSSSAGSIWKATTSRCARGRFGSTPAASRPS
jgi:hypothetical protein